MKLGKAVFEKENGVELNLEVIPNSTKFEVREINPWTNSIKVRLKEKATKGNANKELVKELEKLTKKKVILIQGAKSRQKKVFIHVAKKELESLFESLES